jgi:hypothetical protein
VGFILPRPFCDLAIRGYRVHIDTARFWFLAVPAPEVLAILRKMCGPKFHVIADATTRRTVGSGRDVRTYVGYFDLHQPSPEALRFIERMKPSLDLTRLDIALEVSLEAEEDVGPVVRFLPASDRAVPARGCSGHHAPRHVLLAAEKVPLSKPRHLSPRGPTRQEGPADVGQDPRRICGARGVPT